MDTESDRLEIPAKDAGVLDRIRYLIRNLTKGLLAFLKHFTVMVPDNII